jgi:hypothetical protein
MRGREAAVSDVSEPEKKAESTSIARMAPIAIMSSVSMGSLYFVRFVNMLKV